MSANRPQTKRKAPKTAFKPGQSGNPKGRPKQTKEQKDALEQIRSLAPDAAEWMANYLNDPIGNPAIKKAIAEMILDRTYGKAVASLTLTTGDFSALDSAFNDLSDGKYDT